MVSSSRAQAGASGPHRLSADLAVHGVHPSPKGGNTIRLGANIGARLLTGATAEIAVLDKTTGIWATLIHGGSHAEYIPSGHLVYAASGKLYAVRFDASARRLHGAPQAVLDNVMMTAGGAAEFALSTEGTLVYVPASAGGVPTRSLLWVDRQGRETVVSVPPRAYLYPRISPDGAAVAVSLLDEDQDIYVWDSRRQTFTRLTSDPSLDEYPVWTPDGRHILFGSGLSGIPSIFRQASDGSGVPERLSPPLW